MICVNPTFIPYRQKGSTTENRCTYSKSIYNNGIFLLLCIKKLAKCNLIYALSETTVRKVGYVAEFYREKTSDRESGENSVTLLDTYY